MILVLALCSAKCEGIPKNVGPDEWYPVDPKCSGAVTGCKFEQEHLQTGCNESHSQEQKPDVNWKNAELSCRFYVQTGPSSSWIHFLAVGVEECRDVFNDAQSECI